MLDVFARWAAYSLLGLENGTPLGSAAEFFIEDTIKVTLLLAMMAFLVAVVRTFVTAERIRKLLGGKREGAGNVLAALLGIPTPFCSCSAVPMFIGLMEAGVPLGVTFSFLIASPLINEVAVALLLALFGVHVAAMYVVSGFVIAVVAGIAIGRMGLENEVEMSVLELKAKTASGKEKTIGERLRFAAWESKRITLKVFPYLVLGIGIGALIHGYVPADFLADIAGKDNPFAVPVAVLIGIPLYSNAAGTLPIISSLIGKGMPVGTALALMMSIIGLSLPEMMILRRVLKPRLIAVFAVTLFIAFVITGYLFNLILG